jgi:hypothetical protein
MKLEEGEKPRIYIAGPITIGDTLSHIGDAMKMWKWLLDVGFVPFCPHWSALQHMCTPVDHDKWLDYDFHWLRLCHGVVRIVGQSKGADMEVAEAKRIGIPVFHHNGYGGLGGEDWLETQIRSFYGIK